MSWVKKRGHPTQPPPPVQMYNPNQHSNQEQWQQQAHDNWYNQQPPKQETKTQPPNYWQQPYQQPQPTYNQNSQQYYQEYYQNNTPYQQGYGTLPYNQQYNAQYNQTQSEGDGWSSNWGWGDEDNSNIQQQPTNNLVTESFTNDKTWNWSLDEAGGQKPPKGDVDAEVKPLDSLTGKRNKLETPQWSVESQVSQESSDDILQTSESDKSRMLSRSSTISHSPISGQDLAPGHHMDKEEASADYLHFENKEILSHAKLEDSHNGANLTPPPPQLIQPPLTGLEDAKSNPYKRNTTLSHKAATKFRTSSNVTPPENSSRAANLFQSSFGQLENFETLPENSEQPDPVPVVVQSQRKIGSNGKPWAENNEAPINDRNQYLETGQLSDVDLNNFNQNQVPEGAAVQDNDALPPPGLRRMVLGRVEQQENNPTIPDDPPLPNFTRMVPGQLESTPLSTSSVPSHVDEQPPEGFHRMIPGESSSPESSTMPRPNRTTTTTTTATAELEDDSGPELEVINAHPPAPSSRSATIGADTPPTIISANNRSETIGAADTSPRTGSGIGGGGGGATSTTTTKKNKKRRDSVEGEGGDVGALISSVRSLSVAADPNDDDGGGGGGVIERRSRKESSDSEHEKRGKSPRRYKDSEGRNRSRYSPEDYRDKKYDSRRRYKDRRYEEDTDYYSDKERERRHHRDDRDYDRKYNSLRKDKERERRRRDPRKTEYYYARYPEEELFENESRSRASSRSDSVHDPFRERDRAGGSTGHQDRDRRDRRHRDKDRHHRMRHRDPFNPYTQQGFGYDIYSQYYQQYHYYENLRKTNPQAYAQLYRKYYQEASGEVGYGGEDRASVHSGRSSANDELAKDRYTRQSYYSQTSLPHLGGYYRGSQTHSISGQYDLDDSSFIRTLDQTDTSLNYEDSSHLTAQRLTPAKFATAHTKATISCGKLIKVLPHYPFDGQTPTVEVSTLESLLYTDEDYQELKHFPGPLVKGTTHKKTIIEYCESKIKDAVYNQDIADRDSYVLMWELLILLIRQNGMVVGADIAELLLKNRPQEAPPRPPSVVSSVSSSTNVAEGGGGEALSIGDTLKEEEVTNKFREYLLYGSGKEALEWAMKHGLWGHALFLASKLDKRTYANVLMRFANGLAMNDPLQTLYQLLSGRTPAAVTCVADEKWGDWRPHLAMILSNSTQRPELNCKAITVLGDTLMTRGSLYAAQFCYLMAEVGFSNYGNDEAKLVLLGSNHQDKSFMHFATNEAIHMTEIYEYARSLNDDDFTLVSFQHYKYLLSTRLADVGLLEKALSYLEKIGNFIIKHPGTVDACLVNDVYLLGDRLKYYDPVGAGEEDDNDPDSSRQGGSWLTILKQVQDEYDMGLIRQESVPEVYGQNQDVWQYQSQPPATEPVQIEYQKQPESQQDGYASQYQEQQQYWSGQQWSGSDPSATYHQETTSVEQQQNYYGSIAQTEEIPLQPQISLPNQHREPRQEDTLLSQNEQPKKEVLTKPKPSDHSAQNKPTTTANTGNGWFGGIFSKLTFKSNNQMKLPDDKNPTILWDSEKKRWVNTEDESGEGGSDFKPPPKMAELMMPKPQMAPQAFVNALPDPGQEVMAQKTTQPNIFKLQKGRNLKKSYIDVFNPNSKPPGGGQALAPGGPLQAVPAHHHQMNFFVPQPVNDPNAPTDFLTPAPPLQYHDENAQM